MEIPVYVDDVREGVLTVTRQGNAVVFDAVLRDVGRVVRLKVFGDGEGYLGVPVPGRDGQLRLTRRLAPAALRGFPKTPLYAAERRISEPEQEPEPAPEPEKRHVMWRGGKPYYF